MGIGELMRLIVVRVIADVLHSMGPHIVRPLQCFDTDYAAADDPHCVQNAASAFISAPQWEQCTFSSAFAIRGAPHCMQNLSPGSLIVWQLAQTSGAAEGVGAC